MLSPCHTKEIGRYRADIVAIFHRFSLSRCDTPTDILRYHDEYRYSSFRDISKYLAISQRFLYCACL